MSFHQCLSGSSSQFTEALMWDFFFLVSLVSTSQLMGTASSSNCWCCPLNLLSWSELLSLDPQWRTCLSYNEEQRTLWLNLLPNNVSESLTTTARPHLQATSFPISRRRSADAVSVRPWIRETFQHVFQEWRHDRPTGCDDVRTDTICPCACAQRFPINEPCPSRRTANNNGLIH